MKVVATTIYLCLFTSQNSLLTVECRATKCVDQLPFRNQYLFLLLEAVSLCFRKRKEIFKHNYKRFNYTNSSLLQLRSHDQVKYLLLSIQNITNKLCGMAASQPRHTRLSRYIGIRTSFRPFKVMQKLAKNKIKCIQLIPR